MDKKKESLDNIINNKQIKIVFQPIISLKSGNILGYEALSRITCENEFESTEQFLLKLLISLSYPLIIKSFLSMLIPISCTTTYLRKALPRIS